MRMNATSFEMQRKNEAAGDRQWLTAIIFCVVPFGQLPLQSLADMDIALYAEKRWALQIEVDLMIFERSCVSEPLEGGARHAAGFCLFRPLGA